MGMALQGHHMFETKCLGLSWVSEQGCVNQGTAGKHPLSSNFHFISSIDSSWQLQRNVRGFLAKGKAISKQPSESTSFDGHLWPR